MRDAVKENRQRPEGAGPPDALVRCVACQSDLREAATVCPVCKSHQTRWKNRLQYAAGVVGVFTVLASLLVYIVTSLPSLRRTLWWRDDVRVLGFNSNQDLVFANAGDGDVFVSHATLRADGHDTLLSVLRIGIPVPSGATIRYSIPGERPVLNFITGIPPEQWQIAAR